MPDLHGPANDTDSDEPAHTASTAAEPAPPGPCFERPVPAPEPVVAEAPRQVVEIKPSPKSTASHARTPAAPVAAPDPVQPDPAPPSFPGQSGSRVSELLKGLLGIGSRGTGDEYVPASAVVLLGGLALAVATAAFTLSFQMILPVVTAAGWTPPVSYLGPVVIDIAAVAAAFMGVLSDHPAFARTGRQLLVMATVLSIVLNLAGHQVRATAGGAIHSSVPPGWAWTVELFSIMVPVILAISIHVFGTALSAWLTQRRQAKDAERARIAEQERQEVEAERQRQEAEAERQRREAERSQQHQALREQNAQLMTDAEKILRKRPKKGTKPTVREARALGVYHQVSSPTELSQALTSAGYAEPAKNTVKPWWFKDVRPRLQAAGVIA